MATTKATTLGHRTIPTSDITSGTFADARIPNLATSKITSGSFADARIAVSNVTQHEGSIDALASNPTITLGSNATLSATVDLDTVLPFSSSAFANGTPVYFNVGELRIAVGYATTASSASGGTTYGYYATTSEIQVTGYAHAPRVIVTSQTVYEDARYTGLIDDVNLHSGNTYRFKPWMSLSSSRVAGIQSRPIHFIAIGAKA